MNSSEWESHLVLRGDPTFEGEWGDSTWGFYECTQDVPDALPRTAMCVTVCSLDPENPQVALTLNMQRGGFEIPGGHRDPMESGELEPPRRTALREVREETGLRLRRIRQLIPFGYNEVSNHPGSGYPPLSYMQFYGVHTKKKAGLIADPEVDGAGVFTLDALHTMAQRGAMKVTELRLVCVGLRAVLRHNGITDEHVKMS